MIKRGVDTIQLYTDDFECSKEIMAKKHFVFSKYIDTQNNIQEKYFNNILYGADTKNKYQVEVKNNKLWVKCSIPKFNSESDNNIEVAEKENILYFNDKLEKVLIDNGIGTDTEKMKVSRLDITNNADMKYKSVYYIDMLRNFNVKYIKESGKKNFNTSNTWKNGSKAICIYDKQNEIDNKTISNILRNEVRIFRNENIQKIYNIDTLKNLSDNFNNVCNVARNYEKEILFNKNYTHIEKKESEILSDKFNMIVAINEKQNKKFKYQDIINRLVKYYGIENLILRNGSVEKIVNVLIDAAEFENIQVKYNTKMKWKKQLENIFNEYSNISQNIIKVSYTDLYNECLEKLVA